MDAALNSFDVVCHLRHSAVHARGIIGSNSRAELGLGAGTGLVRLRLDFTLLQSVAGVCETLVRSYNRWIFSEIIGRWVDKALLNGTWKDDGALFWPLFDACRSGIDDNYPVWAFDAYSDVKEVLKF
ncbi:hypothetical protein ACUN7V_10375 [Quadrisphaera oryzae]|uniref:hypothetical protein n=1 Tax=Quadrisphaera TaxID=317661 RepID=UPI00164970C5|nr:hypothetical protein [Quadrisphaera sp. RL12-1S]MBC3762227.1 hypothetical protein [Quadrisphaera sp. RL12-1S]